MRELGRLGTHTVIAKGRRTSDSGDVPAGVTPKGVNPPGVNPVDVAMLSPKGSGSRSPRQPGWGQRPRAGERMPLESSCEALESRPYSGEVAGDQAVGAGGLEGVGWRLW